MASQLPFESNLSVELDFDTRITPIFINNYHNLGVIRDIIIENGYYRFCFYDRELLLTIHPFTNKHEKILKSSIGKYLQSIERYYWYGKLILEMVIFDEHIKFENLEYAVLNVVSIPTLTKRAKR